jgi:hypothetical protein
MKDINRMMKWKVTEKDHSVGEDLSALEPRPLV